MLSSFSPSSASGKVFHCHSSVLIRTIRSTFAPSEYCTRQHRSKHEHRADQVQHTCWREAVSVPTFCWWHPSSIHAWFGKCQVALPGHRISRCNNARELSVHSVEHTTPAKAAPLFSSSNRWRPAWSTFTTLVFSIPHNWPTVFFFSLLLIEVCSNLLYATLPVANPVVDVWSTSKCAPHFVPANHRCKLHRVLTFIESWDICFV